MLLCFVLGYSSTEPLLQFGAESFYSGFSPRILPVTLNPASVPGRVSYSKVYWITQPYYFRLLAQCRAFAVDDELCLIHYLTVYLSLLNYSGTTHSPEGIILMSSIWVRIFLPYKP